MRGRLLTIAAVLLSCCTALVVRPAVRPVTAVTALRAPIATMVTPEMLPTSALLATTSGVVAAVSQQQLVLAVRERTLSSLCDIAKSCVATDCSQVITGLEGLAATGANLKNFLYLAPAALGAGGMYVSYTLTASPATVSTGLIAGSVVAAALLVYNGLRIADVLAAPDAQKNFVAFNLFGSFAMILVNLQGLANLDL